MASRFGHLALVGLISLTGCAMCDNPFDCYYAAYGSRLPRTDMVHGRVGSVFDPPGGGVLTTQEMAAGEFYDEGAFGGESIIEEGAVLPEGTGVEAVPSSTGELFIEPAAAMDFELAPASGREQIERAFEAIDDELSAQPE